MSSHIEYGDLAYALVVKTGAENDAITDVPGIAILNQSGDGIHLAGNVADLIAFKDRVAKAVDRIVAGEAAEIEELVTMTFMGKPFTISKSAADAFNEDPVARETEESLADIFGED